jgi:glycine cleavage system protein P-like pyridoxal-binding family
MSFLPEISVDQLRSVKDIETLCSNSGEQSNVLYMSVPIVSNPVLTASRIANKICPENYISKFPDSRQQGALSSIFDLQQYIAAYTGYPSVSLAGLNSRMAIFSSLSMVIKYHQKNKSQRNQIVMINGLGDVSNIAKELDLTVRFSDLENIANYLDNQCVALVVSLPGIDGNMDYIESLRKKLTQLDIPLLIDGSRQYLLAENMANESLQGDILHLDIGYICGLDKGGSAVLSNSKFSDYLPVPMVGNSDGTYQWETLSEHPLSIGMLSSSPVDLQAVLHCLIYLRMQGFASIQQQAIQSMVMACYIAQQLNQSGIETKDVPLASGCCVIAIDREVTDSDSIDQIIIGLSELPIRLQIELQNTQLLITLTNLHQLSQVQLQRLIEMFILQHRNLQQQQDKNGK